jgi:hypothetical protein
MILRSALVGRWSNSTAVAPSAPALAAEMVTKTTKGCTGDHGQ